MPCLARDSRLIRCLCSVRCAGSPGFRLLVVPLLLCSLLLGTSAGVRACTTAVVSGKATADGRPILWKNRDTKNKANQVKYGTDGKYRYLAIGNAGGGAASVWMGTNEAGLCIENSVISDLPGGGRGMGNSAFMRHVLQNCATVAEVEALLEETNKAGRSTLANFGVIDAQGGAVIFETGHKQFTKFDANDPKVAPDGYVVRSNFTMTGKKIDEPAGVDNLGRFSNISSGRRYCRAKSLVDEAARAGKLTPEFFIRHVARDLADEEGAAYGSSVNGSRDPLPLSIDTQATLSRRTTVSVGVFHGVKPGEDPRLTTMWAILGEPAFSVAVPCWVAAEGVAPEVGGGSKGSPLCTLVVKLRDENYDSAGEILQTMNMPTVWSTIWPLEDQLLAETHKQLEQWRKSPPTKEQMLGVHKSAASMAYKQLQQLEAKLGLVPVGAASGQ